jgi:hypothetical protein
MQSSHNLGKNMNFKSLLAIAAITMATTASFAGASETRWVYQAYKPGTTDKSAPGYLVLTEDGGTAKLRIVAGTITKCFAADLTATVERTADTTNITTEPLVFGCEKLRFSLKNDGTGGTRSVWTADKWEPDNKDRVLTLMDPAK